MGLAEDHDYVKSRYEAVGISHSVYRGGSGPVVLLLHEMPSMSWRTLELADVVKSHGYRVVMPVFIGGVRGQGTLDKAMMLPEFVLTTARICVSWQFVALAQGRTSPIAGWLRALARDEQETSGYPSVGVVGMCFSGGFALATAIEPSVSVAVASQPALPFAPIGTRWIPGQARDPGISSADLARLEKRADAGELCVRAYRYSDDWIAPEQRINLLCERLGSAMEYVRIELPRGTHAHAVLSDAPTAKDGEDEPANRARVALDDLLKVLDERLKPPTTVIEPAAAGSAGGRQVSHEAADHAR